MAKPPCDIRPLAQDHTEDAIKTLAEITKQAAASPAARVSAAIALLDRGWGKSTQPISPDADSLQDATTDELRALLDTVRSLRARDDAGAGRGAAGAAHPAGPPAPCPAALCRALPVDPHQAGDDPAARPQPGAAAHPHPARGAARRYGQGPGADPQRAAAGLQHLCGRPVLS